MKNTLIFLLGVLSILSSCNSDDDPQNVKTEITTIADLNHDEAREILRLNILSEYGGMFKLLELFNSQVFDIGLPCDSTVMITLADDNLPKYNISSTFEVNTNCMDAFMVYNNRRYSGNYELGTQTVDSDIFGLEIRLSDNCNIAGNFEDDAYVYSHFGIRDILISNGVSPELDPSVRLSFQLITAEYNHNNPSNTNHTTIIFDLEFRTNEGEVSLERKELKGTIELIDNVWTVFFEDGVILEL